MAEPAKNSRKSGKDQPRLARAGGVFLQCLWKTKRGVDRKSLRATTMKKIEIDDATER